MCGISASFAAETFKELVALNQSRGEFSFSYTRFYKLDQPEEVDYTLRKGFGKFEFETDDFLPEDCLFHLGHCQAPTGGLIKDPERIHPAIYKDLLLYHNGILKDHEVKFLQDDLQTPQSWDTDLFVKYLKKESWRYTSFALSLEFSLSNLDGSFACVLYKEKISKIFVFRSRAAILFYDDQFSISSTFFKGSSLLDADTIFELDLLVKTFRPVGTFTSKSSPYYFPDEEEIKS